MAIDFKRSFERVLRREFPAEDVAAQLIREWSCDLNKRKIKIYEDEDGVETTDIDVAPLLISLKNNGSVINLPKYERARPKSVREGEVRISKNNRHGKVLGLTAHQKVFSFSVMVYDANVVRSTGVGGFRNFMICGVDGKLREGWDEIEILSPQNDDLPEQINLTYMIHPNRWVSFYGKSYLLAKTCIARLTEELKYLRRLRVDLKKRLRVKNGTTYERRTTSESDTVSVTAFEAVVDGLEFYGEYSVPGLAKDTPQDRLTRVEQRIKTLSSQQQTLRFLTRITEMAFFDNAVRPNFESTYEVEDWLAGKMGSNIAEWAAAKKQQAEIPQRSTVNMGRFARMAEEIDSVPLQDARENSFVPSKQPSVPSWAKGTLWETGYKPTKRARNMWARRRVLPGVFLRWRIWESKQRVAVDNAKQEKEAEKKEYNYQALKAR